MPETTLRPATSLASMIKPELNAATATSEGSSEQATPIASIAKTDDDDETLDAAPAADESAEDASTDEVEVDDEDSDTALIFVQKPQCLGCGHLVAFADKKYKSCHFTAGNEDCPAQAVKIAVQLDTRKIVRNFLNAEEEGDTVKLSRLYAALASKPEWGKRQIMEDLAAARAAKRK